LRVICNTPQTPPPVGRGTPPRHTPHPTPLGAFGASILGAYGASILGASILAPSALGVPVLFHLQFEP